MKKGVAVFVVCLFCALSLLSAHACAAQVAEKKLAIALNNVPPHFNPAVHSGTLAGLLGTQLFAGLLRCDEKGEPVPYLAKEWRVSRDGRRIDFFLHENALFHDDTPITASDVVFSYKVVKKHHPFYSMLAPVKEVRVEGRHQVSFFLHYPYPQLLKVLTPVLFPILPRHIYEKDQDALVNAKRWHVVGSGPFMFSHRLPGKEIILKKFDKFFLEGKPLLDELTFLIFSGPSEIVMALEGGEVQFTAFAPVLGGEGRVDWPEKLRTSTEGGTGIEPMIGLEFNTDKKPFDNVKVRKAFSLAIDRAFISENILGRKGIVMDGPLAKKNAYYVPPRVPVHQNIQGANELLDEAGYPRDKLGQRMKVTVICLPNARSLTRPLLEYLRYFLSRDIGVDLTIEEAPSLAYWGQHVSSGNFQVSMNIPFTWSDPMVGIHRLYSSQNIREGVTWSNITRYTNPRIDALFAQAEQGATEEERREIYAEIQTILRTDVPSIWLATMPYSIVYDRRLIGLNTSFWGILSPMDGVYWVDRTSSHEGGE